MAAPSEKRQVVRYADNLVHSAATRCGIPLQGVCGGGGNATNFGNRSPIWSAAYVAALDCGYSKFHRQPSKAATYAALQIPFLAAE